MVRQNSVATTNPGTMQESNGFTEVVGIQLLSQICHIVCHSIHHHSHIKINSRKTILSRIKVIISMRPLPTRSKETLIKPLIAAAPNLILIGETTTG